MHVSDWQVWIGGPGALAVVIGLGKWIHSALNGKASASSVKKLFEQVDGVKADVSALKTNVAVTKVKVENIETTVGKMDSKLDRLLDRAQP